jgi:transposase
MQETFQWYVGIDWAAEKYDVCVLDGSGKRIAKRIIEHSGAGIAGMLDWLQEIAGGNPEAVAVAIETPRGAVVEGLVERKFAVFAINPKQLDRFRDRYTVAGAKDDTRDAFVLGDSLRTDQACFHGVQLDSAQTLRLRELSRIDEDLQHQGNRLSNQLWEQLHRYYPQMLALSPAADDAWLWDLVEMAPLPTQAGQLKLVAVKRLLRSHRIRRLSAEQVLEIVRRPALRLAPGAAEAASEHVLLLLPLLRSVRQQQDQVGKRIQRLLEELSASDRSEGPEPEHSDAAILLSLPGVGQSVGGTMLAEASQPLAERDYHALRCYAGSAPVTRQSGKRKLVLMRYGCNQRLRNALYYWSFASIQKDAWAREYYAGLRASGHTHGGALRSLGDRWLAVLIAMLKTGTLYDSTRRVPQQAKANESKAS